MNKKIVKIVVLIIFTLFFKLNSVWADRVNYTCSYDIQDYDKNLITTVYDSGSVESKLDSKKVENANSFTGYIKNGEKCPSNVIVLISNIFTITPKVYYASNTSGYGMVKQEAEKNKGKTETIYYGDLVSGNTSNTGGTANCVCENGKNSVDFNAKNYLLNYLNVKIDGKAKNVDIKNWENSAIIAKSGNNTFETKYNYKSGDLAKNSCPAYAIIKKVSWSYEIFLSDEANKNRIVTFIENYGGGGNITSLNFVLPCRNGTRGSNGNSNSNSNSNEQKSYDDPDVNMVVTPLNLSLDTYSCGNGFLESIPVTIPIIGRIVYTIIQILVPVIVILLGSFDLVKAVISQKEDDIKKNQQVFFKRLVGAALVFFTFAIVKLAISVVSDNSDNIMDCVDCIISNSSSCIKE